MLVIQDVMFAYLPLKNYNSYIENATTHMNTHQKWLSQKFYIYRFLTNLWFIAAIWLYFYRLFITDSQVGILDGITFAIGLVAEVPSGALADKFGKDKMTKLGQMLSGVGILIQAFGTDYVQFLIGQAILMIGISFVSGADEALFFEKLQFSKDSPHWRKLVTRGSQIALAGSTTAVILGSFAHGIDPRLPWILTGICLFASALIIWPITETSAASKATSIMGELKEYLASIAAGFGEFKKPKLFLYVPLIIAVQGLFYTTGWGLLRLVLLDRFHFTPVTGSYVVASCSLLTVGVLALVHKYAEQFHEKRILVGISVLAVVCLLLSVFDIGVWGYLVILALYFGQHIFYPVMSEVINYRTAHSQRATVLSVASFLRTLPYVALAPIIGFLNAQGKLEYFLISWAVLIGAAVFIYLSLRKADSVVDVRRIG